MEVTNQVRKRNVKQNEDLSENGESKVTDKFENPEPVEATHESRETKVEVKNNKSETQASDDYSDVESEDDIYHQIYFQGITYEPLFKNEIDPLLKETHITSRGAIIMLVVAAALLLCYSITGLLQALAYRGARDQPVTSSVDDFYHLYGPDGKTQYLKLLNSRTITVVTLCFAFLKFVLRDSSTTYVSRKVLKLLNFR